MARVISDPTNNVVLNFLKWNRACRASRCWVLESYFDQYPPHPPAQPARFKFLVLWRTAKLPLAVQLLEHRVAAKNFQ